MAKIAFLTLFKMENCLYLQEKLLVYQQSMQKF